MVSARYRPFVGGTETHTYEVASRMAAEGHDVTVLTTRPDPRLPRFEVDNGIRVIREDIVLPKTDYYIARGIYREITNGSWDLIHCQGYHTFVAPLAMVAALRTRTPYVVSFHSGGHSSPFRVGARDLQRKLLRPLLARAKRLIAVSNFESSFFQRELQLSLDRFSVVVNGAEKMLVTDGNTPVRDNDAPLIVSVGRLERYKGHHRVIEAMPQVLQAFPDARLRVVGAGPYESELKALAQELGLNERIRILGTAATDKSGMARILCEASLVTLISEYEAYPISVLEALAMGCQVLIANTSGLSELGKYSSVTLIPISCTTSELAQAIVNRIRNPLPSIEMALPSWDDCAAGILDVYCDVLGVSACAS